MSWGRPFSVHLRVAQVFCSHHRRLITNQQSSLAHSLTNREFLQWRQIKTYAEGVTTNVVWTDGKICNFEILDPMNIETLVENTMLDIAVAFFWCYCSKCSAQVAFQTRKA